MRLLPQHPDDIPCKLVASLIWPVGEAVQPHRAGEQVRPGQRNFNRYVGAGTGVLDLVDGQRAASPEFAVHDGMPHLARGHVERAKLPLELRRIVDHRRQVADAG